MLIVKGLFCIVLFFSFHIEANQDIKVYAKDAVDLGWKYFQNNDHETALKRFNQALLLNSEHASAYFGKGYIYSVQGKLDLAIENYRKSIQFAPEHSDTYSNLGLALLYSKKNSEASEMLQKAIRLDPENGNAHVNIALYFFITGDYEKSWQHIHYARMNNVSINPKFIEDLNHKMAEPSMQ